MNSDMLIGMINTLNTYKRSKKDLLEMYITNRLSESLSTYYKDLNNSLEYLNHRKMSRVLKNL